MVYSPALIFSSDYPLGFLPYAGRALRQFQAFLVSNHCAASAISYHFTSIAPHPWRSAFSRRTPVVKLGFSVMVSGSNPSHCTIFHDPLSINNLGENAQSLSGISALRKINNLRSIDLSLVRTFRLVFNGMGNALYCTVASASASASASQEFL